jgi:hypothetical protein
VGVTLGWVAESGLGSVDGEFEQAGWSYKVEY